MDEAKLGEVRRARRGVARSRLARRGCGGAGEGRAHTGRTRRVHYDSCIYIRSKNIRALCRRAPPGISSENNILMYIRPLFLLPSLSFSRPSLLPLAPNLHISRHRARSLSLSRSVSPYISLFLLYFFFLRTSLFHDNPAALTASTRLFLCLFPPLFFPLPSLYLRRPFALIRASRSRHGRAQGRGASLCARRVF